MVENASNPNEERHGGFDWERGGQSVQDKVEGLPMPVLGLKMNGVKNIERNANVCGSHGQRTKLCIQAC